MANLIVMPKLGLTMTKGKILKWNKVEGDVVSKGDVLCEVETDKLTNSVETREDGVLRKIFATEGTELPVSAPMGIVAKEDEDISSLMPEDLQVEASPGTKTKEVSVDKTPSEVTVIDSGGYIRATPYAKRLAKEKGIDLIKVVGTGENERILAKDIQDYDPGKVKTSPTAAKMAKELGVDVSTLDTDGRIMKEDILRAQSKEHSMVESVETIIPSTMRKIIAERMHDSWLTSPRVTFNLEVDVTAIKDLRSRLRPGFEKDNLKLSYNHILMKIVSKVLVEYPYLNGSFDGETITLHNYVNIGLAVDVKDGLLVPNLKGVHNMNLRDISVGTDALVQGALSGNLNPDSLVGGTFTITNVGMFGIDSFSPIINQPEVAILGVNRMVDKPVVIDGKVVVRPMMNLSLTADHRLVDGARAARFLARLKEVIENPYLLLE